jgi:hypothetical protein
MTNKDMKRAKQRAQVKSRFYYLFWGTATVAVVAGQVFVGTGYRIMAESMDRWFGESVDAMIDGYLDRKGRYAPLIPPPTGDHRDWPEDVVIFLN